ncbi:hypothetical protein [Vibrio sp. St2]|uniref:hypothetical protein n=1 Tax=Vibrio sp. St2 TaxID=2853441 RepID=UPI00248EC52B|nr:hypothetical protein [Vibrio sp. St2]
MRVLLFFLLCFSSTIVLASSSKPSLYDNCHDMLSVFISDNNTYNSFLKDEEFENYLSLSKGQGINISEEDFGSEKLSRLMKESKGFLCLTGNERDLRKILDRKISHEKINVMAAIPNDGEGIRATWSHLRDTYSEDKIDKHVKQMVRATKSWGDENILRPPDGKTIAQTIIDAIKSSDSEQLDVIFAHNENGILRFSDGSVIDSTWFGRFNLRSNIPIILSCETYKYIDNYSGIVTSKRLDFEDTGWVVNQAIESLSNKEDITIRDFVMELEVQFSYLDELKNKKVRVALGVTATGGISLTLLAISEEQ